jgi:hypothetical protein
MRARDAKLRRELNPALTIEGSSDLVVYHAEPANSVWSITIDGIRATSAGAMKARQNDGGRWTPPNLASTRAE